MGFNAIRAAITVVAVSSALLGGQTLTTTPVAQAGPCLFGHVDPNNSNSACRGSDSANWPESEANPDGSPKLSCSRLNKGAGVKTWDGRGYRKWKCMQMTEMGQEYWQWYEVLGS
jgi:predicted lipoprotein with Yx(FWY)xxD motif